jgi:hypothetical protein
MTSPQVETFKNHIRQKMPIYGDPEKCVAAIKAELELVTGSPLSEAALESLDLACQFIRSQISDVQILRPFSIIKPKEDWYKGALASDKHWSALESYLRLSKGWPEETITSIHETSNEVVSLLANPSKDTFRCRGLIVGYVQSGKTANMTAVIAKAVDAGYNLIVVLAGMTNKLRAQTQGRLEADIVERHREVWQLYTTDDDLGDFVVPKNGSFTMPVPGHAQLAVMKKVTSRLQAFHRVIKKTPPVILQKLKVLLIDDECDQASVNAARDDFDITKINEAIRQIIKSLPGVSYVGYTATPFANVFIDPFPHNREVLDDLYPEDFITALPRPKGYFGTREVFGVDPEDAGDERPEEAGMDMIRVVATEEVPKLTENKKSSKSSFSPVVTDSLERAILWFMASCAIRRLRGQGAQHMTMLIHTSPNIAQHNAMAALVQQWIKARSEELSRQSGPAYDQFADVVEVELERVPSIEYSSGSAFQLADLNLHLKDVIESLEIVIENGESLERLNYGGSAKTYIVVGGAVLARGLTLEGLCVSFFLRTSMQYDTLLQMGRWFGYRNGYEDLPRLWTTADLATSFRALSHIEHEIREDIAQYRVKKTTPMEFAVKVRAIPGMAITSASKMKHAYRTSISYEGRHVQTIRFQHNNVDVTRGNWRAGAALVSGMGSSRFIRKKQGFLAVEVESRLIRKFLGSYEISEAHMDLRKPHLLGFIDDFMSQMPHWNVGIIQTSGLNSSTCNLGPLTNLAKLVRSRLRLPEDEFADIKALMSRQDILIDVDKPDLVLKELDWNKAKQERPSIPLLLLYPIDATSKAKDGSINRVDLNAVDDLLGIGLVFPGERGQAGNYYAVQIDAPTPEQLDDEDEIHDLSMAAGLTDE